GVPQRDHGIPRKLGPAITASFATSADITAAASSGRPGRASRRRPAGPTRRPGRGTGWCRPTPPPEGRSPASSARPPQRGGTASSPRAARSEEHTSELQSRENLVCRLLLEKKKYNEKVIKFTL